MKAKLVDTSSIASRALRLHGQERMSKCAWRTARDSIDNHRYQPSLSPVQDAVGEPAIKEAHAKKWLEAANRTFIQVRDRRLAEASEQVEVMMNKMNRKVNQLVSDPQCTSIQLREGLEAILAEYALTSEGPTKWKRLTESVPSILQVLASWALRHGTSRSGSTPVKRMP
jgi:hypothetical protein